MAHEFTSKGVLVEAKVCRRMGGVPLPGSGTLQSGKGDFKIRDKNGVDTLLVEHKATAKASYTMTYGKLRKIIGEAYANDMDPAFVVSFCESDGTVRQNGSFVVVPMSVYEQFMAPHLDKKDGD